MTIHVLAKFFALKINGCLKKVYFRLKIVETEATLGTQVDDVINKVENPLQHNANELDDSAAELKKLIEPPAKKKKKDNTVIS